jgi:CheY-like chemotaxis protein
MTNGISFSILLVDDDADDREFIDDAFVEIGYECEIKKFVSGKDLLKYLEKVGPGLYPTLIVLDYSIQGMDATDLLRILKESEAYKHIPVVIYSSTCPPFKAAELKALGAFECLEKKDSMKALVEMAKTFRDMSRAEIKE